MKKGIYMLILIFALACNREEIIEDVQQTNQTETTTIQNGRLVFKDKLTLQNKLNQIDNESMESVSHEFNKLYENGFLSFRPILNPDDENKLNTILDLYSKKPLLKNVFHSSKKLKSSNPEDLFVETENIIADDEFASLLNENGEIQVGDSLYKYTESGLYFVHIKDEDHLNKYLEQYKSLNNSPNTKRAISSESELTDIDDKITRFRVIDEEPREPISSTGNNSTPYILNKLPREFKDFPETSGRQTIFGGIFGDRRVKHAYFSRHRRAKIMYFNQDYLLSTRLGIEVKYQKKGTGIWSSYRADELALGINQAFFALDYKTASLPQIPRSTIFYDGQAYNDYLQVIRQTQKIDLPKFPFKDDISITVNLPLYGWSEQNYSPQALNNMAWGQAYNQIESLMKKLRRPMPERISMVAVSPSTIYINHMDLAYRKRNSRYIKRIFNREFQTPTIVLGFSNNGKINLKEISGLPKLMDAKTINLDFYGGAKRGSEWKGYRMIFKDQN